MMKEERNDIASIALAAAALAVVLAVALFTTGCSKDSGSKVSWSGGITCADGICTPTLTISPSFAPAPAPRAQLEK